MKSNARGKLFINNEWQSGSGQEFSSIDKSDNNIIWQGKMAGEKEIELAVSSARQAKSKWSQISFDERVEYLKQFQENIKKNKDNLAKTISQEMGKPLWESATEVESVINKVPISIEAFQDRCRNQKKEQNNQTLITYHQPHGVLAVFGPFNFPAHLPNGHMIPALLAGNTIVLKPSELTPKVAEVYIECYANANFPAGVINLIQGDGQVGKMLSDHQDINGILFTGSFAVGQKLKELYAKRPGKILALEMGGNNPYIVHEIKDIKAAVYNTIQSAYITSGQRCSCARRLIVPREKNNEAFIEKLIMAIQKIKVGFYNENPAPFMGPVISQNAQKKIKASYDQLRTRGADVLVPLLVLYPNGLLSPSLLDVTEVSERKDEEIFGPLLQLIWVKDFESALKEANNTEYGLAAGLLSDNKDHYLKFLQNIHAGVVQWNRPLTGASSELPFGGIGKSGNFRPSAYYAADYCSYPMAAMENSEMILPEKLLPGLELEFSS